MRENPALTTRRNMTRPQPSVSLDPRDPAFVQDPYPFYAQWRAEHPVFHWEQLNHWCFTAYDDINALLRDRRFGRQIFSTSPPGKSSAGLKHPRISRLSTNSKNTHYSK
jgi:cytochrome P450